MYKNLTSRKGSKLLLVLAAFLLISFTLAFFHHHSEGQQSDDCDVCAFVHHLAGYLVISILGLIGSLLAQRWLRIFSQSFNSLLRSSTLQGRAPPLFS
jgi:hypothetical protein